MNDFNGTNLLRNRLVRFYGWAYLALQYLNPSMC